MTRFIWGFFIIFLNIPFSSAQDSCLQDIKKAYMESNFGTTIQKIEECYPDSVYSIEITEILAKSFHKAGWFKEAKNHCLQMLEDSISESTANHILAQVYHAEENTPKAIKHYLALYNSDTTQIQITKKLAALYLKGGDKTSSFYYYRLAHKLNPKDITVINAISEILIENEQINDADSILSIAYTLDSTNIKVMLLQARVRYMLKDYAGAVSKLDVARHAIDFSQYFNKLYGYSLLRIDSVDQAIYYLEKALVGERSSREYAHYYLATAYEKKEMPEYSIFHYEKAIGEAISNNTSTYFKNLALIYEEQGEFKKAIANYKKSLEWNSGKNDIVLFYLARTTDNYYKDKSIALRYYKQYVKSSDPKKELLQYSENRIKHLKGIIHMSK